VEQGFARQTLIKWDFLAKYEIVRGFFERFSLYLPWITGKIDQRAVRS
jgi:hypothetical protein